MLKDVAFPLISMRTNNKERYPRNTTTLRGTPFWDGSEAQKHLEADVKAGRTDGLAPAEVMQLRPNIYCQFPLDVFRNHLHAKRLLATTTQ